MLFRVFNTTAKLLKSQLSDCSKKNKLKNTFNCNAGANINDSKPSNNKGIIWKEKNKKKW